MHELIYVHAVCILNMIVVCEGQRERERKGERAREAGRETPISHSGLRLNPC